MAITKPIENSNRYEIINKDNFFHCTNSECDGKVSTDLLFDCEIHSCCQEKHRYKMWQSDNGVIVEELKNAL